MHYEQRTTVRRLAVSIPIFAVTFFIMQIDFNVLWRYFAWCNQTLAVFTLWAVTVYLARHGKIYWITMLPAMFMTCVCTTYILFAPEGLQLDYNLSLGAGVVVSLLAGILFMRKMVFAKRFNVIED